MDFLSFFFPQWILIFGAIIYLIYRYVTKNNDFFLKRGIKFIKPLPILGNLSPMVFRTRSFAELFFDLYNAFPKERFFGVFEFTKPVYFIRDPELLKQITVKDFDHFVDHRLKVDENIEPMFGRGLFAMKSEKWRDMRSTLSPAFTGSKMRQMFCLIVDCSKSTANYIFENSADTPFVLEMKDFFTRYATDVIGTCAFGIKTDSLKEDNEFYKTGKLLTNFDGIQGIKFFGYSSVPKLMKFLKIKLFDNKLGDFFRNLVHGAIKYRQDNNIIRPDMINLLIQAQKGYLKHEESDKTYEQIDGFAAVQESEIGKSNNKLIKWTDDDLTAQCVLFFLAGFDTVSTLMCFMSYELAVNPDIQAKLLEEIDTVNSELNGQPITYEILQKMKYMDMIVCETLRKWPPVPFLDRNCNKDTILETSDGKNIQINQNDGFWFPVYGIHNDPQYFPDPSKFIPERFSDENKNNIKPFTYIPFGVGPRNCIGSRFALMEVKAVYFEILSKLTFELSTKSQHPIKFKKDSFNMSVEKGFWVQCRRRVL